MFRIKNRYVWVLLVAVLACHAKGACPAGSARTDWTVRLSDDEASVIVANDNHAPDASDIVCRWNAYRDGESVASGSLPLHVFRQGPVRPGQAVTNAVPRAVREIGSRGGEMSLEVRLVRKYAEDAASGYLAQERMFFSRCSLRALPPSPEPPHFTQKGDMWIFSANAVTYVFNSRLATLSSVRTGDWFSREWLAGTVSPELSGFRVQDASFTEPVTTNGAYVFEGRARCVPSASSGGFPYEVLARWTVRGDGWLLCRVLAKHEGAGETNACVSLKLPLSVERPLVQYFAKPPASAFALRGVAGIGGQSHFSAVEVRALAFDSGWSHLSLVATGAPVEADVTQGVSGTAVALSSAPGCTELAFAIAPVKRLAALPAQEEDFPATSGHEDSKEAAEAASEVTRQ